MSKLNVLVLAFFAFCLAVAADFADLHVEWSTTLQKSYVDARVPELNPTKYLKDVPLDFSLKLTELTDVPPEHTLRIISSYVFPTAEKAKCTSGGVDIAVTFPEAEEGSILEFDLAGLKPSDKKDAEIVCVGFTSPSNTPATVTNKATIAAASKNFEREVGKFVSDDLSFVSNLISIEITPKQIPLFVKTKVSVVITPHTLWTFNADDDQMQTPYFNLHFNDYNITHFVDSVSDCTLHGKPIQGELMDMSGHKMQMLYWKYDDATFFKGADVPVTITCDLVLSDVKNLDNGAHDGDDHHHDDDDHHHVHSIPPTAAHHLPPTPNWSCVMGSKSTRHTYFAPIIAAPNDQEADVTKTESVEVTFTVTDEVPLSKKTLLNLKKDVRAQAVKALKDYSKTVVDVKFLTNKVTESVDEKTEKKTVINTVSVVVTLSPKSQFAYAALGRSFILSSVEALSPVVDKLAKNAGIKKDVIVYSSQAATVDTECLTSTKCGSKCFLCENVEKCESDNDCLVGCVEGSCVKGNSAVIAQVAFVAVIVIFSLFMI